MGSLVQVQNKAKQISLARNFKNIFDFQKYFNNLLVIRLCDEYMWKIKFFKNVLVNIKDIHDTYVCTLKIALV